MGEHGFTDGAVDLGHGLHAVIAEHDTGDDDQPTTWDLEALEHPCRLDDGTAIVQGVPADAFAESHQVTFTGGRLTVRPTIACDACGLHGEITDGRYQPIEADR